MAKKPRTPPPPRRVQAPKTRRPERAGPDKRVVALAFAALLLAAAVGVGAFLLLRSDGEDPQAVRATMVAAGCTYEEVPAGTRVHINNPNATPKEWNTNPPTSGPHFGAYVIWGEYEEPVQKARAVHNLEHGGIWISYGEDVSQAEIDALRRFYREDPDAMLLSPLPELGDEIAIAAWYAPTEDEGGGKAVGVLAKCKRFDENAFRAFRDTFRFKGPERFPREALNPGE